MFRGFLYSKWFFLFLAVIVVIDLLADIGEEVWGWTGLNELAIVMDIVAAILALWIFADLHHRRPKNGGNSSG